MTKTCRQCGKEFEGHSNWKVCSVACQIAYAKARAEEKRKRITVGGEPMIPSLRPCKECGCIFKPKTPRQIYCIENGCSLKVKNRRRRQLFREDKLNLTTFRKNYTKFHTEAANVDPDPVRREAKIRYMEILYSSRKSLMHLPAKKADEILAKGKRQ